MAKAEDSTAGVELKGAEHVCWGFKNTFVLAHIAMWFVSATFSVWNVVAHDALAGGAPAIVLGCMRAAGATPLLFILAFAIEGPVPTPQSIPRCDMFQLAALGFTNGVCAHIH